MKHYGSYSFRNMPSWGKVTKPAHSKPLGVRIHVPQSLLWVGLVTAERLKQPIELTLMLQNDGDAVWQSHVSVSSQAYWLTVNSIHNLIVPPGCALRLPVTVQQDALKKMTNGVYRIVDALQFDQLAVSISAWMLLML